MVRLFSSMRLHGLYFLIITLQGLDLTSTYWAFETGKAVEKNLLLVGLASATDSSIEYIVLAAKMIVIALFAIAFKKSRETLLDRVFLVGVTAYYVFVCASNFYWVYHLS